MPPKNSGLNGTHLYTDHLCLKPIHVLVAVTPKTVCIIGAVNLTSRAEGWVK